ncbi:MAG: TIGR03905 family TSCPD domain-containing protein [Clostridia bacterium]|nr:TIGR03905 family TSCPD domain-containing protein [Clostridia bacterium]MBP5766674.1 TIGR03905 family TSCPD domain-containing protein [Clostridia bacterium]
MHYEFYPEGVCSRKIDFDIDGDVITNVRFTGGCNGNLKAIAILVDGMTVDEIERKLKGNTCGFKNTSCADQFAKGVRKAYNETAKA